LPDTSRDTLLNTILDTVKIQYGVQQPTAASPLKAERH
jgi:hypothetical protein